jgi:hypothetical protein
MTSTRTRPLFNGDAILVEEREPGAFAWGGGRVIRRWPVANHLEEQLRQKLASKMTTTALLAGFVLTALVELTLQAEKISPALAVALGLLSLALGMFVASLYVYDQLGMPEGFWTDGPRPWWLKRLNRRKERRLDEQWQDAAATKDAELVEDSLPFASLVLNGPMFNYMVRTHRMLFTPGVLLGCMGIGTAIGASSSWWLALVFAAAVLASACWYLAARPALSVD